MQRWVPTLAGAQQRPKLRMKAEPLADARAQKQRDTVFFVNDLTFKIQFSHVCILV